MTLSSKPRSLALSSKGILGIRQAVRRAAQSLPSQQRWVASVMVLAIVALVPIAFLTMTDGGLNSLARFVREIGLRNPYSLERNSNASGRQGPPGEGPNASNLFGMEGLQSLGADFSGAQILGVQYLSASSSVIQILVPAGVEGAYQAAVEAADRLEYQCVILHHYTDQLHCIGPSLPESSRINLQIFKIDEASGSQLLVFEVNYTTGDFVPPDTPTPTSTPTAVQTPTPTLASTRFAAPTSDDSDTSDDDPPPTAPPPSTSTSIPPTSEPPLPTDTPVPPTDIPVPPTDTPVPPTSPPPPPAATDTPRPINPPSCNSDPDHQRYCTPSPDS